MATITIKGANPEIMKSYPAYTLARVFDINKKAARDLKYGKSVKVEDNEEVQHFIEIGVIATAKPKPGTPKPGGN